MNWIYSNDVLLGWLAAIAAFLFIVTLLLLPVLVILIPEDYFDEARRRPSSQARTASALLRAPVLVFKNLLGLFLVAVGLVMLVTPGQGLMTILVGFMLTNFPGKYRVERWIIRRAAVRQAVNWLRQKANRPPLIYREDRSTD